MNEIDMAMGRTHRKKEKNCTNKYNSTNETIKIFYVEIRKLQAILQQNHKNRAERKRWWRIVKKKRFYKGI